MMKRVRNWDVALARWARGVAGQPFTWGETDCVSLVRASLRAVHGEEVLPATPTWTTLRGARRAAKVARIDDALHQVGARVLPFVAAQAGDVLLLGEEATGFQGVGVVLDEQVLLANPEHGVYTVRRTALQGLDLKVMRT